MDCQVCDCAACYYNDCCDHSTPENLKIVDLDEEDNYYSNHERVEKLRKTRKEKQNREM